jgi:hypothetical protein
MFVNNEYLFYLQNRTYINVTQHVTNKIGTTWNITYEITMIYYYNSAM